MPIVLEHVAFVLQKSCLSALLKQQVGATSHCRSLSMLISLEIDIWSAGVILLTFLTQRFPFFNSSDDIDATIEIATMFGKQKTRNCAALHGIQYNHARYNV